MSDLITSARAKYSINQSSFTAAEDTTISALVTAVSKSVRRFCRREFDSQSFDELYSGNGGCYLQPNQYPLLRVSRDAVRPRMVLAIRNSSSPNHRANLPVR